MLAAMTKKRALPPDRLAECEAAHELFLKKKGELKLSQKKLADKAGMTAPAVNLYFKGVNPLNAKFAAVLARELQVDVADFSPRLAEEIRMMTPGATPPAPVEEAKTSSDLVLQMLMKNGRSLSDDARRRIIEAVHDAAPEPKSSNVIVADFSRPGPVGDEISIAHYDIRGAMGGGQVPSDYAEMMHDVKVSQQHLRELGVAYTDSNYLKVVTGWGQSMAPTIKHRDPLIVDISIREFVGDGVYVFTWQSLLYIKRLQLTDADTLMMISDNSRFPPQKISSIDTYIHAKVLLVWNAQLL